MLPGIGIEPGLARENIDEYCQIYEKSVPKIPESAE
jgi:hypothetical protein